MPVEDDQSIDYINESILHEIVIDQGAKAFLTKHVVEDNNLNLFKPYKDLCLRISVIILKCKPEYKYSRSLSNTIIEVAHMQKFFKQNLPSLTDFADTQDDAGIISYLEDLVFSTLQNGSK